MAMNGRLRSELVMDRTSSGHALRPYKHLCTEVFKDILDMYVVVYLDVIPIYSDNPEEHLRHVCDVLRRLRATPYTPKSRSALSAWTRRTASVPLLALAAFEWTPRRSKLFATARHHEKVRTSSRSWVSQTSADGLSSCSNIIVPLTRLTQGRPAS